ncbi:MAG: AraC family transcriptional regulator [Blautia sp.]|nr:AraC family transcriptional regulator [Blautia sp.]MDY3716225.1 AraC family transcriptional regulator [Blautia sp.]
MKKNLQSAFHTRQYMLSKDFEIYYYSDYYLSKVESHTHNYYEFYFFLEGNVDMIIEGDVFSMHPGDLVLIPPKIRHHAEIRNQELPYRRFVFWISREYCKRLLELSPDYVYLMQHVEVAGDYVFSNDIITFNTIQSKVFALIDEMRSNRFGRDARISLCVNDLILHLNRIVHERNYPRSEKEDKNLYQSLAEYIEKNLEGNLSLEHLAEVFYVSKYHIAHTFKDHTGLSIHQYITKKRLTACREAILGGSEITQAYLMFGFGDYSSFYRAFKKEYGISPREFRRGLGDGFGGP